MENLTSEEFRQRSDLLDYPRVKIIKISDMPNERQLLDIVGKYNFEYSPGIGNTIYVKGMINTQKLFDEMHNIPKIGYIWGDLLNHESEDKIRELMPILNFNRETLSFKLYVGNQNTGSHVHYHSPAANFLLYGLKLWWLFPKTDKNTKVMTEMGYSKSIPIMKTVRRWVADHGDYIKSNVEDLVIIKQNPGEVLIIPNKFYHLIINLEPTIGVVHAWEEFHEFL